MLVTFVVGVGGHADTSREQLRSSGRNDEGFGAIQQSELNATEGARKDTFFNFRLCHGSLKIDIPHGGRLATVNVPLLNEVQKAPLCDCAASLIDCRVFEIPVDGKSD